MRLTVSKLAELLRRYEPNAEVYVEFEENCLTQVQVDDVHHWRKGEQPVLIITIVSDEERGMEKP